MVEHLVFFKLKPETPEASKINMLEKLRSLQGEIPEILEISCGENFTDRAKNFNLGLRVLLNSKADLSTYSNHPAHLEVVNNHIKPILDDIIALDYVRD